MRVETPDFERRGGSEFLQYLKSAPARTRYRRMALDRALARYRATRDQDAAETLTSGAGLAVVQHAMLIAEDLGCLLHALLGDGSFDRLRDTTVAKLRVAYTAVEKSPDAVLAEVFALSSVDDLRRRGKREDWTSALIAARNAAAARWLVRLRAGARFFEEHIDVAKALQHGAPIVAGALINTPPGAGDIAAQVRDAPTTYAVAIPSGEKPADGLVIHTRATTIALDTDAIEGFDAVATVLLDLITEISAQQARCLESGWPSLVPCAQREVLSTAHRQALAEMDEAGLIA